MLAPEGDPNNAALDANPSHNPNLGLNNPAYFQPGNFNESYNFSGDNGFEQSAFYAASQLAFNGPVIIVAEAGLPSRSPITGAGHAGELLAGRPRGQPIGRRRQRVRPVQHDARLPGRVRPEDAGRIAVRAEPG